MSGIEGISSRISAIQARIDEIRTRFGAPASPTTSFAGQLDQAKWADRFRQAGPTQWDPAILAESSRQRLDPGLLRAVMLAESGGDPSSVSPAGAQGLMQLMPETAAGLGVRDPFDPKQSLQGGARYLRTLLDRFGGDVAKAVAAYNAGPGAVDRYGGIPPYPETQAYVERVLELANFPSADEPGGSLGE